MSFAEALNRATNLLGRIGVGSARQPRALDVALVELMFEEIQAGGRVPEPHLALPPHLGGEAELRGVLASHASKDKVMRADVFEWAEINRRIVADNAQSLRILAEAFCKANDLLREPGDEVEEKRLHTWMSTILAYTKHVWGVDLRECPSEREAHAWSLKSMVDRDPVPEWVHEDSQPFQPKKPRAPRDMFMGAIGNKADRAKESDDDA